MQDSRFSYEEIAISIIRRLLVRRARGNPLEFHREKWSSGWRKLCKVILNFARDTCERRPSFLVPANDKRLSLKYNAIQIRHPK